MVPVGFPGVYVADVDFYNRRGDGADGIGQGNGRMGVGAGIQHNTVRLKAHFVYFVDEPPFVITLIIRKRNFGIA